MCDCIIKAAGVDWLTLSSVSRGTQSRMLDMYSSLVLESRAAGHEPVKTGMHGFMGSRIEHAYLMEKDDRLLFQVTGERAFNAPLLCQDGDTPSRLDIQVTVQIAPGAVPRFLNACEDVARSSAPIRGRRPYVHARHGEDGNETVYIGKPASNVQVRCYDKFKESKDIYFKDCVRFEVQLRHKQAAAVWRHMAEHGLGTSYLIKVLYWYLNIRGITTDWIESDWSYVRPPKPLKKTTETQEAWWATQVAPGIAKHVAEHGLYRSFCILYEQALTSTEKSAMLEAAAIAV